MKYWVNTLLSLLIVMAMSSAQARQDMPQLSAIESWGCQANEGKSMHDLMRVIYDWNEWSDENGLDAHAAWVLNLIFNANADFAREAGWFGYAPKFTELGKGLHA